MAVLTVAIEAGSEAGAGTASDDAHVAIAMTTAPVETSTVVQDVLVRARARRMMIVTTAPPDGSVKKSGAPDGIARVAVAVALAAVAPANPPS